MSSAAEPGGRGAIVAEGSYLRLRELQRLLSGADIPAELVRPGEKVGNR
jgi:hypothetical protein